MSEEPITKEYIRKMVTTDYWWSVHAIEALYERQTEDEKSDEVTYHKNGVGFTGPDSMFLTSMAKQIKTWREDKEAGKAKFDRPLSSRQIGAAQKLLGKYAGQLLTIARAKEAKSEAQKPAEKNYTLVFHDGRNRPHYQIVYPDERRVYLPVAKSWVEDALVNGEIPGPASLPLDDLMEQLESEGMITLSRKKV